jgi:3-methylfumaryl-CoA hydratase
MRLAAATGHALDIDRGGPALAHWAWFHDLVAAADIGPDGHPKPSVLLPATGKPRRMFASATISFEAPFELGELADFEERVADQRTRHGLSGELVLMEIERRISQHGKTRIVENRTLVYRDSGGTTPPVSANAGFDGNWRPREVDLFRFSAATFNSHRIHYDRAYAQIEEGYPDLVVHGPFTACKLADLAAQEGPLETFAFRAEAPLFVGQVVRLERQGESFVAIRCDGAVAMTATATWKS